MLFTYASSGLRVRDRGTVRARVRVRVGPRSRATSVRRSSQGLVLSTAVEAGPGFGRVLPEVVARGAAGGGARLYACSTVRSKSRVCSRMRSHTRISSLSDQNSRDSGSGAVGVLFFALYLHASRGAHPQSGAHFPGRACGFEGAGATEGATSPGTTQGTCTRGAQVLSLGRPFDG